MRSFGKTALCAILSVAFVVCSAAPAGAITAGKLTLSDECYDFVMYSNIARRDAGRQPLTMIPALQSVADLRAKESLIRDRHVRPDGSSYKTAYPSGLTRTRVGENLSFGMGRPGDPEDYVEGLVDSPVHYETLTAKDFTHIAVGVAYSGGDSYFEVYSQNFLAANCRHSSLAIVNAPSSAQLGTKIEQMRLLAKLSCSIHGESYLPVSEDMVTGYDPFLEDVEQTVTVSALGLNTTFNLRLTERVPENGPLCFGVNDIRPFYNENTYRIVEDARDVLCVCPRIYVGTFTDRDFKDAVVRDKDGGDVGSKAKVASGMTLKTKDGKKYTLSVKGDTDGDSVITAADARLALRFALEIDDPLPWQRIACMGIDYGDFENDITAGNARQILRAALGETDPFEWFEMRSLEGFYTQNYYYNEDGQRVISPYPDPNKTDDENASEEWRQRLFYFLTSEFDDYDVSYSNEVHGNSLTITVYLEPEPTGAEKKKLDDFVRKNNTDGMDYTINWRGYDEFEWIY